jgi:uncharacterized protein YbaP (TraB family)
LFLQGAAVEWFSLCENKRKQNRPGQATGRVLFCDKGFPRQPPTPSYSRLMKLNRLSALALFVVCSVLHLPAQTPTTKVSTNKTPKHCLWEVKGKSNTVFLLGSLHLMKKDMYPLDAAIETAYRDAQVVVFETDIAALESPEFAMKLMAQATYPEGETLKKNLPEATYSLLVSNLQASIGSAEAFEKFKPWMVAVTLVALELQKLGFSAEKGLDKHFYSRAKEDKKSIRALETPDEQLKLLTSLNDLEAGDFLGQSLRDMATW